MAVTVIVIRHLSDYYGDFMSMVYELHMCFIIPWTEVGC